LFQETPTLQPLAATTLGPGLAAPPPVLPLADGVGVALLLQALTTMPAAATTAATFRVKLIRFFLLWRNPRRIDGRSPALGYSPPSALVTSDAQCAQLA
jgi:hypothetical protein